MKTVIISCNIQIDIFDTSTEEETKAKALEVLDIINLELQRTSLESSPQILTTSIDNSDIHLWGIWGNDQRRIYPLVQIDFPYPFSPDEAGDQEEVVGLFKDEENNVQVLVWNWDEGGDRGEDVYNQEYALNSELFSEDGGAMERQGNTGTLYNVRKLS